jgi:hypothetical protein
MGGGSATGGGMGANGTASLSGPLAFTPTEVKSVFGGADGGFDARYLQVAMLAPAAVTYICNNLPPPVDTRLVGLSVTNPDGGAVVPNTYAIGPNPFQGAYVDTGLAHPDAGVNELNIATGGTVTVTAFSASRAQGSFSVTLTQMSDGGTSSLSGTFDAPGVSCH